MTQVKFVSYLVQIHLSLILNGTNALTWYFFLLEFTPVLTDKVVKVQSFFSLFLFAPKYITFFITHILIQFN